MPRWKLTIEYDGTGFCGWQKQPHGLSVQQVLEEAVRKFSGEKPSLQVAGRTDAGVHARGQVAHFDLERPTCPEEILGALNFHVKPHRVAVLKAEAVPGDFHARFSALARIYKYTIVNRRAPLAIDANFAWHVSLPFDLEPVCKAASLLAGKHDFSTFRAHNCQAQSPVKTLDFMEVERCGDNIVFTTGARSFLYHQVRNMVGSLVMVGTGRWSVDDFAAAFAAADRTRGGPTAPPQGLCFWKVEY